MAYYRHPKDTDLDLETAERFESRADAYKELPTGCMVTFHAFDSEISKWRYREYGRFDNGTYQETPWHYRQIETLEPLHFVHLSIDCPGLVAYTVDIEHGIQDRQTRIKPGRYLQQFYADRFTPAEIAEFVAQCSAENQILKLARTADEITTVYNNGPSSCMDGSHEFDPHPCIVYALPSDLAVAYIGPIDSASQRCVVWPDKHIYSRIYGTGPLRQILEKDGYLSGRVDGAKILRILHNDSGRRNDNRSYLMPYIDGIDSASECDHQFIVLDDDGPISTSESSGYSRAVPRACCEHCGESYNPEDDECSDDLCASCYSDSWSCYKCEETFFSGSKCNQYDDENYCDDCYADLHTTCQEENCTNQWIEDDEFTDTETALRKTRDTADLCRSCADKYLWCDHCDASYFVDVNSGRCCPTCERSPRCEHTGDLLTVVSIPFDQQSTTYDAYSCEPRSCEFRPACNYPHVYDIPVACDHCHGAISVCPLGGHLIERESDLVTVTVTL